MGDNPSRYPAPGWDHIRRFGVWALHSVIAPQLLANIGASATERGMILLSSHVGRIVQTANSRRNHVQSGTENPDQLATVSQKVVTVLSIQC